VYRQIFLSQFHQGQVGGANGPSKQRRVHFVKAHARLHQHAPGDSRLQDTIVGQGRISPANEAVIAIPGRLWKKCNYYVRGMEMDLAGLG
jgi:hypothetical protein